MQGYTTEERDANAKQNLTQFYALMFDAVSDFYFIFFSFLASFARFNEPSFFFISPMDGRAAPRTAAMDTFR